MCDHPKYSKGEVASAFRWPDNGDVMKIGSHGDSWRYSRRDFLTGVVACSTASAVTIYLLPGGRTTPRVELSLVTGVDPTGARQLLLDMWNDANPNAPVTLHEVRGATDDQRSEMIDAINNNDADVVNLDIIHIPFFADQDLITPIELDNVNGFLEQTRRPGLVESEPDRYWAAPFNADAGMFFERLSSAEAEGTLLGLAEVVDDESANGSPRFVGQLNPSSSVSQEAFVVNILEHALARNEGILGEDGEPEYELTLWEEALEPLRAAIAAGRILRSDTEENSRDEFRDRSLRYMRNWPVKYRELQQMNDPDAIASRILVRPLPVPILGGQSLALTSGSRHESEARELIRFLTSDEAQKVLAAHGLAPTRVAAYNDENLSAFTPHLESIRGAVEAARPRPIHRNYSEFSEAVLRHMTRLLDDGEDLPSQFIDEMRAALA
jgi:multiple sugar transport system substrate-binding protein